MSLYLAAPMLASPESINLPNGLMAYWELESDSTDSVGSSDGTDTGITYAAAKVNNGATGFNGSADKITIGTTTAIKPTTAMSISAWIKREASGEHRILSVGWENYPTALSGFQLLLSSGAQPTLSIGNDTGYTVGTHVGSCVHGSGTSLSTWAHVVGTWDGSTIKVYLNGGAPASIAWTGGCAYNATVRAGLGYSHTTVFGGDSHRYLTGDLDEVGLWNRALNATEVAALYNGGSGRAYANF